MTAGNSDLPLLPDQPLEAHCSVKTAVGDRPVTGVRTCVEWIVKSAQDLRISELNR